jgi:hypothetical protein
VRNTVHDAKEALAVLELVCHQIEVEFHDFVHWLGTVFDLQLLVWLCQFYEIAAKTVVGELKEHDRPRPVELKS